MPGFYFTETPVLDVQRGDRFHQVVERLQLRQEWFQLVQRQGAGAVAAGVVRVRMGFQEQAGDADGQAGAGQVRHLLAAAARSGATGIALLQRVRDVEDDRQVVAGLLHDAKAQHVDHQVVVAEARAAVAQDQLVVARFLEFFDDIGHLARAQKLRLLDVDDFTRFRQGHDQVRLARQEGGQLQHVDHLGHLLRLPWLMHVGNHGHAERRLHVLEDAHAFFQARAAVGMDR